MERGSARRTLLVPVVTVLLAACGTTSSTPSPAPTAALPLVSPAPSTVAPAGFSASPTPASEATVSPAPATLVLGGTWRSPKAGARLTSYATTLSAKPSASGAGTTTFTKIVFSAAWPHAKKKVMCTATQPGTDGVWSCKVDLLARGVPPGMVSFSFDVFGAGVSAARSPAGVRKVTYAVPPPGPSKARWAAIKATPASDDEFADIIHTYRVQWSAPAGYADQFLVYETDECPRPSTEKNAGKACFVPGTLVDASKLKLLAKAPADARSVTVRVIEEVSDCGSWRWGSILLRARNAYGASIFAIVDSATVEWMDPNEAPC
jgi:hypothetical protein